MSRLELAERWSSRRLFVAAAVGAVVGLGNVWQMPHLLANHGGGLFLLLHVASLLLLGLPLMLCELLLGRRGDGSAQMAVRRLVREGGAARGWWLLPWLLLAAALLLLVVLAQVGGWLVGYLAEGLGGGFGGLGPGAASSLFDRVAGEPLRAISAVTLFVSMAAVVAALPLRRGLERMVRLVLPLMALLLLPGLLYAVAGGHAGTALARMVLLPDLVPDLADLLPAVSQGFYALLLGAGVMLAFATHLPSSIGLARTVPVVVGTDLLVTLLAGLVVLSLEAASGPAGDGGIAWLFLQLPTQIGSLPEGPVVGGSLLLFALLAAWTTAVALFEPLTLWLRHRLVLGRASASAAVALLLWLASVALMQTFSHGGGPLWLERTVFEWLEWLGARVLLPTAALGMLLFVAWALPEPLRRAELAFMPAAAYRLWLGTARVVAPLLLALVFLGSAGILSAPS